MYFVYVWTLLITDRASLSRAWLHPVGFVQAAGTCAVHRNVLWANSAPRYSAINAYLANHSLWQTFGKVGGLAVDRSVNNRAINAVERGAYPCQQSAGIVRRSRPKDQGVATRLDVARQEQLNLSA